MELEEIKTKEERAKENEYESQEENTRSEGEDKISEDTANKGESVYSKLQSPAEDIYSATSFPYAPLQNVKDFQRRAEVYRGVAVILSILSLILAAAVIALCVKLQTQPVCLETYTQGELIPTQRSCSKQECSQICPRETFKVRTYMRCDPGWKQFGSSCFYFARGWKTWAEGREECKKKGGDLAIVDNKNLQEFLTKNGNLAYWIGLTQADSGEYVWINNVAVGQSYWSQSKREGKCGFLIGKDPPNHSWGTAECSHNTAYICQKEA
ncbi:hypothetical protein AGOR_G00207700 [Albula goreensis]|uniref:C-type lectin domain-containing protein n=1 Tax=Albula goreensis TaxID=1534307 RepID=A0A8T3CTG9_9TELE|nr:hypothetical protein AGOR_G00207700 [Albula goreensis]